jgi:large repetitive protein
MGLFTLFSFTPSNQPQVNYDVKHDTETGVVSVWSGNDTVQGSYEEHPYVGLEFLGQNGWSYRGVANYPYAEQFTPEAPVYELAISTFVTGATAYGGLGTIYAEVSGGVEPYAFRLDDGPLIYGYNATWNVPAGTYYVNVIDGNNDNVGENVIITQPAPPPLEISISSSSNPTTLNGTQGSVTVIASGGTAPYEFVYTKNGSWVNPYRSSPDGNFTFNNLGSGSYTFWVKDSTGTMDDSVPVILTDPDDDLSITVTVTNVTTYGGSNGQVTINATGTNTPFTYFKKVNGEWVSNPSNTFTGLSAGTYEFMVQDNVGANRTTTATVTQPANDDLNISASVTGVTVHGGSDGRVLITATGTNTPFTYFKKVNGEWVSNPSNTFTGLSAGTYEFQVTDSEGFERTTTATVTQPANDDLNISASVTGVTVHGGSDGRILITATGTNTPFTYSIKDNGEWVSNPSNTFTGLSAGTYEFQVTDSEGFERTTNATVTQPANDDLNISASVTGVTVHGGSDGRVLITATGTNTPFTYFIKDNGVWVSGATNDFTGLSAGTYEFQVTDSEGFERTTNATVTQPAQIYSATSTYTHNCEGSTKQITHTVTLTSTTETYNELVLKAYNEAKAVVMAKVDNDGCIIIPKGHSNLVFGEETILLGNVRTKIEEEVEKCKHVIVLSAMSFYESTNPTWSTGKPIHITEVGIYDGNNNLVAIGKINKPILKVDTAIAVLQVDMEF